MKKYFKSIIMAIIILPCLFLFSACGGKKPATTDLRENLTTNHISLSDYQFEYDGKAKTPSVTVSVNGKIITPNNYTVTYTDNIEIGTASVTVTSFDASTLIKGSATKYFQIVERVVEVSNFNELVSAIDAGEHQIVLTNDIPYDANNPTLQILANEKSVDLVLNLSGHKIERDIDISNYHNNQELGLGYYDNSISLTICNGQVGLPNTNNRYGICVFGNQNVSVNLTSIESSGYWGGLYTNGNCAGATLHASECSFTAGSSSELGAYLASNYNYVFQNCIFEGDTAVYIKSGVHEFNDCTLVANGTFKEPTLSTNGCSPTGSTVVIESNQACQSDEIVVNFINGSLSSANNYAVHAFTSSGTTENYIPITVNFEGTVVIKSDDYLLKGNGEHDIVSELAVTFNGIDNITDDEPVEILNKDE